MILQLSLQFCAFWRFVHFEHFHLLGPHGEESDIIGVACHPTMYIYSLRHFLTTKGALIDGDVTPPLPPLKWVKKGWKNDQNSLKIDIKKQWKTVILNGKSHFFIIFTQMESKNDKNWSKIDTKIAPQIMIKFDYQKGG